MKTNKLKTAPKYNPENILDAIKREGLVDACWGWKTPTCIWICSDGMEKDEIWDKFPSPLNGYEPCHWNHNEIYEVTYFMLNSNIFEG